MPKTTTDPSHTKAIAEATQAYEKSVLAQDEDKDRLEFATVVLHAITAAVEAIAQNPKNVVESAIAAAVKVILAFDFTDVVARDAMIEAAIERTAELMEEPIKATDENYKNLLPAMRLKACVQQLH